MTESGHDEILMAGIGVEFSTRRRNRFGRKTTPRQEDLDGHQFGVCVDKTML